MATNPLPEFTRAGVVSVLDTQLGLFRMGELRLATGRCRDAATIAQALWYFVDETIALPRPGIAPAGFARGVSPWEDLRQWASTHALDDELETPPLLWVAAPDVVRDAQLSVDGSTLTSGPQRWSLSLTPKIALNRSYYDRTSTSFFAHRRVALRGSASGSVFTARTLWPEDFRLDPAFASGPIEATPTALRALVRARPRGGAQSPFAGRVLWERSPRQARQWEGAPVLALVLNGAQGDDDEAHAGHFALVTGYVGRSGAIGDWITNNFYTLDTESEKGILPAMVPLDNYLGDLNSGQAWYRPSYLVVAVLKRERVASHLQGALERTYNQFYRHQLVYSHPSMNCASISVDLLRVLGWNIPTRGATSWMAAALGLPYLAAHDRSVAKGAQMFDYLTEDQTRLLPAAAFEEIGADLLKLAIGTPSRTATPIERALAEDIEAIAYLEVPQFPSSRVWGDFPVATAWEYRARYPRDAANAKIIPVPPRAFPAALRDADLLPPPRDRAELAIAIWAIVSIVGIPWLLWRWWRRAAESKKSASQTAHAMAASDATLADPSRPDAPSSQ